MLHVYDKTSKTVAFRRTDKGYEWLGEQEIFQGPRKYESVDGTFNETITITYDRVAITGFPVRTIAIDYDGDEPELVSPPQLTLGKIRPWLAKWGYE
jgi:hypothetical protein